MKYRKKPVVIEAVEFHGWYPTLTLSEQWFADAVKAQVIRFEGERPNMTARISTLEGVMTANPGDYIILGVRNEVYPCKPDIFAATYEPVE